MAAQLNVESGSMPQLRVLVFGAPGTGKSSLIEVLCGGAADLDAVKGKEELGEDATTTTTTQDGRAFSIQVIDGTVCHKVCRFVHVTGVEHFPAQPLPERVYGSMVQLILQSEHIGFNIALYVRKCDPLSDQDHWNYRILEQLIAPSVSIRARSPPLAGVASEGLDVVQRDGNVTCCHSALPV
jgi:hypothetical protein